MKTITVFLLLAGMLLTGFALRAQNGQPPDRSTATEASSIHTGDPIQIAREYVAQHLGDWGLIPADVQEMTVNDRYTDATTGITRVYFLQRYRGIPVYNAILNINIDREGQVYFAGNRFVADLGSKVNAIIPVVRPEAAVSGLTSHLGLPAETLPLLRKNSDEQFVFGKGNLATEDIPVTLSFQPDGDRVLLAWDILLSPAGSHDKWSTRVDAVTGAILHAFNWTVYCRVAGGPGVAQASRNSEISGVPAAAGFSPGETGARYNVWPAPLASPADGPRTLVSNPADPVASPFGWHDTNGLPGPEYTTTRGNNTFSFQDRDDLGHSSNDEPDGGTGLNFDFPWQPAWEPVQHIDASVVNLFYWTNYMHDFAYRFGFDEPAGNFQVNNYGKGGVGNDGMNAVAQAAANQGLADYPFYRHGNEGSWGAIFMMEATPARRYLTVDAPSAISGKYTGGLAAPGWGAGAYIDDSPVTGEVALVDDGVEEPFVTDGCESIVNAGELAGKIALIDRGGCQMGYKALQAQNAGAIGVIVSDDNDEYLSAMTPGAYGEKVNIPIIIVPASTGHLLRQHIGNGLTVSLVNDGLDKPAAYDMSIGNQVISHEYGHGISWRLCGGPNAACFDNPEQMDEGWSDFFSLATTVLPGDTGAKPRGWAPYVLGESPEGHGTRRYMYSTDMNVSPLTYGDVAAYPERHNVGEVWCNVIWDMYWALVEKYGWSADPYLPSSGNHKAIRLVFDGLKNLPCSPGFVDGRNAILAADSALYGGENACLLWRVFARRGLGYSAEQGSPFDTGDQKEAFDLPTGCRNELTILKSVTDFIQPGDDIQVTLRAGNNKSTAVTNVVVTDEIPSGTTFVQGSASMPASVQGNIVSFYPGALAPGQEVQVSYRLATPAGAWSERHFLDDVSDPGGANWITGGIGDAKSWSITNAYPAHSGAYAWNAREILSGSRQFLELRPDAYSYHVEGSRPVLRFYHRYETAGGINGGIVEVKENGGPSWIQTGGKMLRNGYSATANVQTFQMFDLPVFTGNSGSDFKATYVDLNDWSGKDIRIRFRFASIANAITGLGWLIDDIEFMDLLAYNGEACVSSDQGDLACAIASEAGTIVDSRPEPVGTEEKDNDFTAALYPNPATGFLTLTLPFLPQQETQVRFLTAEGKEIISRSFSGSSSLTVDLKDVPAGLYFVQIRASEGRFTGKAVVSK